MRALELLVVGPAWADHGALRTEGMNPIWAAVLWAVVAFALGMAVVGIVSVLVRRRRESHDG